MKKQFLNLGKALNKAEQKQIFGGGRNEGLDPGTPCTVMCNGGGGNQQSVANCGSAADARCTVQSWSICTCLY